jgi:hypothetical protein
VYKYLFETLLLIILGTYPKELPGHMVVLCLIFVKLSYCFLYQLYHFMFPLHSIVAGGCREFLPPGAKELAREAAD